MEVPIYKRLKLPGGTYENQAWHSNDGLIPGASQWNNSDYRTYYSQQIANDRRICNNKRNWNGTPRCSQMSGIASHHRNASTLLIGSQIVTVNMSATKPEEISMTQQTATPCTSTTQPQARTTARPQAQIPNRNTHSQCRNTEYTSNMKLFAIVYQHARSCPTTSIPTCNLNYCQKMKVLIEHQESCALGVHCSRTDCAFSRILVYHWHDCKVPDCINVCNPLQSFYQPNARPTLPITEENTDNTNVKPIPVQNSSCQTHENLPESTSSNVVHPNMCNRYSHHEMIERRIEADNLKIKAAYPDESRIVQQNEGHTQKPTQTRMPHDMKSNPVNKIYFVQNDMEFEQHSFRPPLTPQLPLEKPKTQPQKQDPKLRQKQRSLTQPIRIPNTLNASQQTNKSSGPESKDRNYAAGNNHTSSDRKKKDKSTGRNRETPSVIKERQQPEPITPHRESSSSRRTTRKTAPILAENDARLQNANCISKMVPGTMIDRQPDSQQFPNMNTRRKYEDVLPSNNKSKKRKTEITAQEKEVSNVENPDAIVKEEPKRSKNSEADVKSSQLIVKPPYAFSQQELFKALMPTLAKLIGHHPESACFLQPVDHILLRVPSYPKIVKNPMDLGTIHSKLKSGAYLSPWAFIDDVWLMFENAWLFNSSRSTVHRYCTKLSEVFKQEIDPVMRELGYCCGIKYKLHPPVKRCYGTKMCIIPKYAKYHCYEERYQICHLCFNNVSDALVTIEDDQIQSQIKIKKSLFTEKMNDETEPEKFISCIECGREHHQICELYLKSMWPKGFVCENCLKKKGVKREVNKFSAKNLYKSRLGMYIEARVNDFLQLKKTGANKVYIRVLSNVKRTTEVKPLMRSRYVEKGQLSESFPYRAKAIFAFQEVDGNEVCIFGMHVQEYNSECPSPNARRIYLAYIDSVHYFRPAQYRTAVYHEILLGYMNYVKQLGYTKLHIWACPPAIGDDYMFNCHSAEQKMPNSNRLQKWYQKLLDKGVQEKIIVEFKDIITQLAVDNIVSITELPYFDGDYWPKTYEEKIEALEQEVKLKKIKAAETSKSGGVGASQRNSSMIRTFSQSYKIPKKNCKSSNANPPVDELKSPIINEMKKHKNVFFIVHLHSVESASRLGPIQDADGDIYCDFLEQHDKFLVFAREKKHEFSSMRRALHSTLVFLHKIHGETSLEFNCNNCSKLVQARYHCPICPEYDLCIPCMSKIGHQHKMQEFDFVLMDDESAALRAIQDKKQKDAKISSTEYSSERLDHVLDCKEENCPLSYCKYLKRVVMHYKYCRVSSTGGCSECKQFIKLGCYVKKGEDAESDNPKTEYKRIQVLKQILKQSQSFTPQSFQIANAANRTGATQISSLPPPEIPASQSKRSSGSSVRSTREDIVPARAAAIARIERSQQPRIERPANSIRKPVYSQIAASSSRAMSTPSSYISRENPVRTQPRGRPPLNPRIRNDRTQPSNQTQPKKSQTNKRSSSNNRK